MSVLYKNHLVNAVDGDTVVTFYSENHMKPTDALFEQNTVFMNVRPGGTYQFPLCSEELTTTFDE
jgi:hypothetical protein